MDRKPNTTGFHAVTATVEWEEVEIATGQTTVLSGAQVANSLEEFAEVVPLGWQAFKKSRTGVSRMVDLFVELRNWGRSRQFPPGRRPVLFPGPEGCSMNQHRIVGPPEPVQVRERG